MRTPVLRALVLTEDTAHDADETVRGLLWHLFRHVAGGRPDGRLIEFTPVDERARMASKSTHWKSPRHKEAVRLRQMVAAHLASGGFVFFHVDGDTPWSRREQSENAALFEKRLRAPVRLLVAQQGAGDRVDATVARLHLVMPFYSIEAWLFQNARVGLRLAEQHGCAADVECFEAWAADRALLDVIEKPKAAVSFGARFNGAFVEAWPAADVIAADGSFAAVARAMAGDDRLGAALRAAMGE